VSVTPHTYAPTSMHAFRLAIAACLTEIWPNLKVADGMINGPSRQRDIACVWPIQRQRLVDHALEENVTVGIRIWKRWQDQKDPDRPIDPAPLEALSEELLRGLSKRQQSLGTWMLDVQTLRYDVEDQGIEAIVVGRQWNPFAMCEEDEV